MRRFLFLAVLVGVVGFTACDKKKETSGGGAVAAPAPDPNSASSVKSVVPAK